MWQPNIAALAAARPVITWDLRGHGSSDAPDDLARYSRPRPAWRTWPRCSTRAGSARVVAGGLSLGGFLSLEFWLAHPDRVAGLVLCDTGPGYRRDEARQQWNDRAWPGPTRSSAGARGARHSPRGPGPRGLALAARGMLTQRDARVIDALPAITVPALVLVGADGTPITSARPTTWPARSPAPLRPCSDAGHAANIDQPDAFNAAVLAFLGTLPSAAPG